MGRKTISVEAILMKPCSDFKPVVEAAKISRVCTFCKFFSSCSSNIRPSRRSRQNE